MKQIAIYGAGGFGREVAWLAETCDCGFEVVCFADDDPSAAGKELNGIPVVDFESLKKQFPGIGVVPAIGSPLARQKTMEKLEKAGFSSHQLIHPRTEMSRWIETGEGTIICAGCILTTNIRLGKHVQINLDCTVGHDVVMGDYTTLAPGVHVSGWVHFGKRVYVGTGAVFINGTKDAPLVIGAGACVTKSISCGIWGGTRKAPRQVRHRAVEEAVRGLWIGSRNGGFPRSRKAGQRNTTGWCSTKTI
jgi:sugar O-acyltransferase (sialic acid O-acetyltransferase NeuD family)